MTLLIGPIVQESDSRKSIFPAASNIRLFLIEWSYSSHTGNIATI
jgi:hypothetical protein